MARVNLSILKGGNWLRERRNGAKTKSKPSQEQTSPVSSCTASRTYGSKMCTRKDLGKPHPFDLGSCNTYGSSFSLTRFTVSRFPWQEVHITGTTYWWGLSSRFGFTLQLYPLPSQRQPTRILKLLLYFSGLYLKSWWKPSWPPSILHFRKPEPC